jgi:monovalent cation:H+ antiporter, CPA1 family
MLSAHTVLAIFSMLGLSSFAIFWAKRVKLPHTVFLVIVGIILGLLGQIPFLEFFLDFKLTPELLFFLLLPTLIFESAYNMSARRLVEDTKIVLLLSILSLIISTAIIGGLLYGVLGLLGFSVPLIVTLLFGALISATDPVAVLALFKEYGAPRRLSLIFEGESLFNDATSVALFLVLLEVVLFGYHGFETIGLGILSFTIMMIGGVLFGAFMGGLFSKLVGLTRENETASITLTIVLAHVTFILAELISSHIHFGDFEFRISSIIATTIASLIMGNYGRPKIHPRAEEFVEKLWGHFAFMANSLIFILIGILFIEVQWSEPIVLVAISCTVIIVAFARSVSIYPVVGAFNYFEPKENRVPRAWQHLLSWGSLRGALAVTMVLLIPESLSIPNWTLTNITPHDFILALTVGCIFATLFFKATTIQSVMRKLHLDELTDTEKVEHVEATALIHHEVAERLKQYAERGYISQAIATSLLNEHSTEYNKALSGVEEISARAKNDLSMRVLRMYAIGIERKNLKELYHYDEVNERVYRRIQGKLTLQLEAIEQGKLEPDMSLHTDSKDIFEQFAATVKSVLRPLTERERIEDEYMYYRAQTIISRKVQKTLSMIDKSSAEKIFTAEALVHTMDLYGKFRHQSEKKMNDTYEKNTEICSAVAYKLALSGVNKIEETLLEEIHEQEFITPKLYLNLQEEFKK